MRLLACSRFRMVQIKYLIIVSRSPSSKQTRRIVKSQLQEEQDCKVPAPTLLADCREYPRLQALSGSRAGFSTCATCTVLFRLGLLVVVFPLHPEREEMRNSCEATRYSILFVLMTSLLLFLQDALPPPPPPPPQSSGDGAAYSLAAGQRPSPSISDQSGRQRPTV